MTDGVLAQARQKQLQQPRFRVGEYELREPDYRQICLWAEALALSPRALMTVLATSGFNIEGQGWHNPIEFALHDGALHSIAWNLSDLPKFIDEWIDDLSLKALCVTASKPLDFLPELFLAPKVSSLLYLCVFSAPWRKDVLLHHLNLVGVPELTSLACIAAQVTKLDLSPVATLAKLRCGGNRLSALDLSPVPKLTELFCGDNLLPELDLSSVPGLTELSCGSNLLTELHLSPLSMLRELRCNHNQLLDLDLSPVPRLVKLWCDGNQLRELDLSQVPELSELRCDGNQLTELDLAPVPRLSEIWCDRNVHLRNFPPDLMVHHPWS